MNRFSLASVLVVALVLSILAGCGAPSSPNVPPGSSLVVSDQPRDLNPVANQGDLSELADGNAAFASDLYRTLRGEDGNLFFSPYSISTALAMTYAGAAGDTASQMAAALHFDLARRAPAPCLQRLRTRPAGAGRTGDGGNAVRAQHRQLALGPAGLSRSWTRSSTCWPKTMAQGMRLVDYQNDAEGSRRAINDWVSERNARPIQDLIPAGAIDAMTRLVLANAIYFKAGWLNPFEESATGPEPFHLLDGSTAESR